jgi:UDP-N-acetylmuramoyl-L-alanyl-D-glutamate--2,6-diaminopimelate ligase
MYSVENGLLTMAICSTLGLEIESVIEEMGSLRIPGRFETVELEGRPESTFVIDYAHNGASLSAVLRSLREYDPKRIICLFGSVGGRTFNRRAELARAAKDGADIIIITSDNPDTEDPMKVIEDIYSEISNCGKEIYLISNRKVAIEKAYSLASAGDIVLLAGKGHERYQLVRGERIPFSERKILECVDALAPITD